MHITSSRVAAAKTFAQDMNTVGGQLKQMPESFRSAAAWAHPAGETPAAWFRAAQICSAPAENSGCRRLQSFLGELGSKLGSSQTLRDYARLRGVTVVLALGSQP